MPSGSNSSEKDSAIALFALAVDLGILVICAAIKRDMDFVGFVFAGLIIGWMVGLAFLKSYRTRKPKKKLFFFLFIHLIPLPIAIYLASS